MECGSSKSLQRDNSLFFTCYRKLRIYEYTISKPRPFTIIYDNLLRYDVFIFVLTFFIKFREKIIKRRSDAIVVHTNCVPVSQIASHPYQNKSKTKMRHKLTS